MNTSTIPVMEPTPGIAGGNGPMNGTAIELVWPGEDQPAAAPMTRRGILLCSIGQVVARAVPLPPKQPAAAVTLRLGLGVAWDAARAAYVACRSGHARLLQNKLDVLETLDWPDDLDAANGPFHFEGDVILRHGVLDLVVLRGSRDITVHGCIEAADVQAGRDLTVHHGICGKEKGIIRVGGRLTARFLSNARIIAGGDISVENEIDTSHVQCGGELRVARGTILAGHVNATASIHCHTAGAPSGVKTILELGVAAELQTDIHSISDALDAKRQKAREIRDVVEPLLAHQKALSAAQKEKATELLFMADQMESEAHEMSRHLDTLKRPMQTALDGAIHIASVLHPGVVIRYPNIQAGAKTCLHGPLTARLLAGGTQRSIVATDDFRGTKTVLLPTE